MKYRKTITILVLCIAALSLVATIAGIFTNAGPGEYEFTSIHGRKVLIYGKGIYKNMSSELAPQGIAQDVVTFFIGTPLLLISLYFYRKGLFKGRLLLTGALGYFLMTYLFYMIMGMYNNFFLIYVILTSTSFFAFILALLTFDLGNIKAFFKEKAPVKLVGRFLMFNSIAIAFLWLSVIVPPLLEGIVPVEVEHYTTLIVQGMDLSIMLPIGFVSGLLLLKRKATGYLLGSVYIIFLSLLMSALVAKIVAMTLAGVNAGPALIVIPAFLLITIICMVMTLKNIDEKNKKTNIYHLN